MKGDYKKNIVWYWPLVTMVLFALTWYLLAKFLALDPVLMKTIENANIKNFFIKYNQYFGIGFGLGSLLLAYLLLLIGKLAGFARLWYLMTMLSVVPWLVLALQLIYREERYTDLARALIVYSAWPMLIATLVVLVVSLGFFKRAYLVEKLKEFKNSKAALFVFFLLAPMLLSGCVGDLILPVCPLVKDQDVCYQTAAIQESRAELCEKIVGKNFLGASSNPPRDKCYLKIAETSGDLASCNQIKGGLMSYSREECLIKVGRLFDNPLACQELADIEQIKCRMEMMIRVTPQKLVDIDSRIMQSVEVTRREALQAQREAMYDLLTKERREEYEKIKKIK